ncbi:MAG: hypothetical protein ACRD12_19025 [Acidimicrobiales bacterium]
MTPTLTRPHPLQHNLGGRLMVGTAVAVVAIVGILLMPGLRVPGFVDLSVSNPSRYAVQVDVTGGDRAAWLNLGVVGRESTRDLREILDQGSTWVFRFSHAGRAAGELVVSRSQLRQDRWELAIPPDVAERLARSGVPASVY